MNIHDFIEEFSPSAQLSDQVDVVFILENLIELDDVRVVQVFQDINLVLQTHFLLLVHSQLIQDLDCPHLLVRFVNTFLNLPERPY